MYIRKKALIPICAIFFALLFAACTEKSQVGAEVQITAQPSREDGLESSGLKVIVDDAAKAEILSTNTNAVYCLLAACVQ